MWIYYSLIVLSVVMFGGGFALQDIYRKKRGSSLKISMESACIGAAAGLYTHGIMTSTHMSIIMPGIFLMGALIQYMGRILGVAGVDSRHYPMLFFIGLLNAALAMLTMKWLIV